MRRSSWLGRAATELFSIDRRSLALFRIGLGTMVLWDFYGRAQTLREHYTAEGVFPRSASLGLQPSSPLFHLFLWSDRLAVQALLFGLFAVFALLLVVGYRTRLVSVLVYLFLVSLVRRNPYVCHTGDTLLKALSFWAMLLPLGSWFSVDRLRSRWKPPQAKRVLTLASAGALLQVAIFYVSAGYLKTRYDVWKRGDAVWVFTHAVEYTRPLGVWLGRFPSLCRFLTYATLVLEGCAPFLFFCPFGTPWIRGLLIVLFAGFHLTLSSVIHIGIFQWTCIVGLSLLIPSAFWDALGAQLEKTRWPAWRASWRARFGKEQIEPPPASPSGRCAHALTRALAACALAVILISNLNTARKDPYDKGDKGPIPLPTLVEAYGRELTLVQNWNMFTDIDRLFFGWFVVLGQLDDGSLVNVLDHTPYSGLKKPEHYSALFPNHNTRRYWREVALPGKEFLLEPLSNHLAAEWQRDGGAPLAHLAIFQVGRIPSRKASDDQVKKLCVWGRPRPDLEQAPAEEQRRWLALREQWKQFLAGLPKTVPASS